MRLLVSAICLTTASLAMADEAAPDYATQVAPILQKYCVGCHNDDDREGEFSLESYSALRRGTPKGPVFTAGHSNKSRILAQLTGAAKPVMPPKGEPRPSATDIAVIKAWIDAGASGPSGDPVDRLALVVPKIPSYAKRRPVTAVEASRGGKWLAQARYAAVDLYRTSSDLTLASENPRACSTIFQER